MLYSEFQKWLDLNRPVDISRQDFLEFCAFCGALTIQNTIINEGLTVSELIEKFFDKGTYERTQ